LSRRPGDGTGDSPGATAYARRPPGSEGVRRYLPPIAGLQQLLGGPGGGPAGASAEAWRPNARHHERGLRRLDYADFFSLFGRAF